MFKENEMLFINVVGFFPDRVDYMVREAKRVSRKTGLKRIAFCMTMQPEGSAPEKKAEYYAEKFRDIRESLKETDILPGILVQSIMGHGWNGGVLCEHPWHYTVNITGKTAYRFCPLEEGFRRYAAGMISRLAEERPSFLLIDDDIRLINNSSNGLECFCELHVREFNRKCGREFTSESLRRALLDAPAGDPLAAQFDDFRKETLLGFAELIRKSIDLVDSSIPCGYCAGGGEFMLMEKMAKTLAGNNDPFLRIHNAMYLERSAQDFPIRMYHTAFMKKAAGDIPYLLDESDTCPHNRYSKSAIGMHTHITGGILNGLNGGKLWITNLTMPDPKDSCEYEDILARHRGFYNALMNCVKTVRWQGPVTILPDKRLDWRPAHMSGFFTWNDWQHQLFNRYGIPGQYGEFTPGAVHLLTGDTLRAVDDSTLKKILSGKALLDGDAAFEAQRRGFGPLLGVRLEKKEFRFSCERVCSIGDRLRFMNDFTAPFITVSSPDTEVLTELVKHPFIGAPEYEVVAPGMTFRANASGGQVAVTALNLKMTVYNWLSPERKRWLIGILDKLNGEPLPFLCTTDQDVYLRHGILPDGAHLVALVNLNFDPLGEISLRTPSGITSAEVLDGKGGWKKVRFLSGKISRIKLVLNTYQNAVLRLRSE